MNGKFTQILLMLCLPLALFGQVVVNDNSIQPGDSVVWTAGNEYLMDGLIYVENGARLTIEAGTVIRGKQIPTTGDNTSALIIARGGKIYANGSASQPIIFTAEDDDLGDPNDLILEDRGLWGGLILLGYGTINTAAGVGQIEGIDPNEPRAAYGGGASPNDNDNSGVLRYVSIRHGGSEIAPGDEINALTLGAVGGATLIEYIEVSSNLDDGVEWFGGTVNIKYLVSAFNADDGIDYDEGFRGKGQFWLVIQGDDFAGRSAEQDGGTNPEDGQPYAIPVISNATYIGPGVSSFPQGDGGEMLIFRDNAGGKYYNSIFTEYNGGQGGVAVRVEDLASGQDSRQRLEDGDLVLRNNIWWQFGAGNTLGLMSPQQFVADSLAANNNQIVNPELASVVRQPGGNLDPRPSSSGPAASGAISIGDPFFTPVNYYGAFDPNAPLWFKGWTALSQYVTGIEDDLLDGGTLVKNFGISQNYPNPFNPSTSIRYYVAKPADVKITVYNIRGQKVATLVNGFKQIGEYMVTWNTSDLPTGLYFYRFEAGGVVETRKMTLLK